MAQVIIYDTQTGIVLRNLSSVHTPDYEERNDVLINPSVPDCAIKYMKVSGTDVLEMTTQEKEDVDAASAPSYSDLRRSEYAPLDGDFHDALAKCIQTMKDNGIKIHSEMDAMLTARANIKSTYPKPE